MSTPAASTKSINSSNPEAQNATNSPTQQNGNEQNDSSAQPEGGYPPQRHAGAIGYGPEYGKNQGPTTGDKLQGFKEQVAGKITRNQDKVEHGRELRSGELKRKQKEEEEEKSNPFQSVDEDEKKAGAKDEQFDDKGGNKDNSGDDNAAGNAASTTVTDKRGPGTHPTEAGAQEQAATTAPEGTDEAEQQRMGENVSGDKQIDERNGA